MQLIGWRLLFSILGIVAPVAASAELTEISIKALDSQGKVLRGIRFTFAGVETFPTNTTGVTELQVPPLGAGQSIRVDLPTSLTEVWVLIDSVVHAPASLAEGPVEVVLIRRREVRLLASRARDTTGDPASFGEPVSQARRRQILVESAKEYGLNEEQLAAAIAAFGKTQDPMDEGIAAYLNGQFQTAHESLSRAVEEQKGDLSEALAYLGATEYEQGKIASAEENFRQAVVISPNDARTHRSLGAFLMNTRRPSEARMSFGRVIELNPERGHNDLGVALAALGELEQSEDSLHRALEIEPISCTVLRNLGAVQYEQGKFLEAAASFSQAINLAPEDASLHNQLGHILENHLDQPMQAEERYFEAVQLDPGNSGFQGDLCKNLLAQMDFEKAEVSCGRALELDPENSIMLGNVCGMYHHLERYGEAETKCRRGIELDPEVATLHGMLGVTLHAQGRYVEAEASLVRAIDLDPDNAARHAELGTTLDALKKFDEAERSVRRAVERDPENPDFYHKLGHILLEHQQMFNEAQEVYLRAIDLDPEDAAVHFELGLVQHGLEKFIEAEGSYRMAIDLDPESTNYYSKLAHLLDRHLGRPAEAEKGYRRALELDPMNADFQAGLGESLYSQKKYVAAEKAYHLALELNPASASSHFGLGNALHFQRRYVEAEATYRRAVELEPSNASYRKRLTHMLRHTLAARGENK